MNDPVKLCKDCKWCFLGDFRATCRFGDSIMEPDYVNGGMITIIAQGIAQAKYAQECRKNVKNCGPSAKYWEPQ